MTPEHSYHFLWLLLLIPAGALLYITIRWKQQLKAKLGDSRLVAGLFKNYSAKNFLLKGLLVLIVITLLTIALVNFRKPDDREKVKLSGTDLMIALDVSNSMLAQDVQPSRLDKAKLLIGKLIDRLQGNRIGLVVFAGNAYLQMPLTTDAAAVRLFLSNVNPGLVPYQGTNISEALQLCNRSLNTAEKKYKSVLLITDGEDHDKTTLETTEKLKEDGVVINTVGVGSPEGANIIDPVTAQPRRDEQGNTVISKLNQTDLQKMAAATNGSYILLSDADVAATEIARQLSTMDQKPITNTALTNFTSYYYWFVLAAALLLIAELLISETKKQRKMMKPAALLFVLFLSTQTFAQTETQQVRKGNDAYRKQDFDNAAKDYEAALKTNNNSNTAAFNLGNTRFKAGKYDEAAKQFETLGNNAGNKQLQAQSLYNKGLAQVKQQKLDEAIQSFKQSLRLNPSDEETRENLQKALNEKKQQEQQKKEQDKKDNREKKDDKKDKDKQDQQDKQEPKDDKEKQQPQPKINKQDAEQKLQALRQEEKKLQQKLNERKQANVRQPEKDW